MNVNVNICLKFGRRAFVAAAVLCLSVAGVNPLAGQPFQPVESPIPNACAEASLDLLPWPARVERLPGECLASSPDSVVARIKAGINGYTLDVTPSGIAITAADAVNVFYARQTLAQLTVSNRVPCVRITDYPRFSWRGLMLDCSRTFQSLEYLHQTVDRMAAYKMNVLHLHLTDDQGWRIEIKKHPELTRKAARFSPKYNEPESHQGFYTQAQLCELVTYAAQRGVTIVPEIEMPGHSLEVLVCHPELSCAGKIPDDIFPFSKGPNITPDIFCAGNEATFAFLQDVIDEVVEIFPSRFIHIGGDEAPKARWKACPKCQARIKAEGLKDEQELQSYFIRRIEKYINGKGRRLIGWSEILQGGLAPNAAVMDWIGGADNATRDGHDAVMSPTSHCYFDYPYSAISAERAYGFEPCAGLPAAQAARILGLQANFWSHIDREPDRVDQQLFPRLLSLAERGWSPAGVRDWPAFRTRLRAQVSRLRAMGVHCRPDLN
jgi:hexosaminidase